MLEKLGKRRYAAPVLAIIIVFCILALVMYPTLNAAPRNVPFALVNLDAGMNLPTGPVNMGAEIAKKMQEGVELQEGVESPLAWTELNSQAALDAAFENNEFYGAIIIPKDFTSAQLAIAAAAASAGQTAVNPEAAAQGANTPVPKPPTIQVIINQGKNVMLATTMQTALTSMLGQTGLSVEVSTVNAADTGGGGMAALMSGMIMVMPTFILTLICSALLYLLFRPAKGVARSERIKAYVKQLVYAVAASALVACAAVLMVAWVGSMDIPVATSILFLWFASFCLMALFIGALDVALPLGALVIITCFALGMGTSMLAYEMLPGFWQNWVYPWAPQRFISGGVSSIIYMGRAAWNDSNLPLAITGCVGIALMLLTLFFPVKDSSINRTP